MHSKHWTKLGTIAVPPIPRAVFDLPHETGHTGLVQEIASKHEEFWLDSTLTPVSILCRGSVSEYTQTLDLPAFERGNNPTFLMTTVTGRWHSDIRQAAVNIAILNGSDAAVEFNDGTHFVMQDGDVYCLDTVIKHRVAYHTPADRSRVILTLTLKQGYFTDQTQQIIKDLREYFAQRSMA